MKLITTFSLVLVILAPLSAQKILSIDDFEDRYDVFLEKYNHDGLIDYRTLKSDDHELLELLDFLDEVDFTLISDQNKATLINAYNLSVISAVVQIFPIKSPLDQKNFFTEKSVRVGGNNVSLDELEKQILFKKYPDFRLHFALVCAAIGCPKLPSKAFRAISLESQLEKATKASIRSPILVQFSQKQNTLSLSELFSWYLKDFGGTDDALLQLIQKYSASTIPNDVKIDFTKYNWALNSN